MNNAGRIGFVPRGNYNRTTTYDFLDVVYFGHSSYVAKKLTIGNEPAENNEYWQILAMGPTQAVTGVKGAAEEQFRTGDVLLTPQDIGASESGHTHYYAGSNTQGGIASSAASLTYKHVKDVAFSRLNYTITYSDNTTKSGIISPTMTHKGSVQNIYANGDVYYNIKIPSPLTARDSYEISANKSVISSGGSIMYTLAWVTSASTNTYFTITDNTGKETTQKVGTQNLALNLFGKKFSFTVNDSGQISNITTI